MRAAPALFLAALVVAPAACAAELPPRADQVLARGQPYVEVRRDPDGEGGVILGAIDVEAPAEVVFKVVTDCNLATRMVASLKSCRVLERDPAGRWDVREYVSKMTFLPQVRNVFRSDYEAPSRVRFHRVAGDLKVFEGEWRIEPQGTGVRVVYENRISAPFRVPGYLSRFGLRMEVPQALLALRREALLRAP